MKLSVSIITTTPHFSALVIMRSFLFGSSFIAICFLSVKLRLQCYIGFFIIFHKIMHVRTVWWVSFGFHFSLFLLKNGSWLFSWFIVVIHVSSLKWAPGSMSRKKFYKSKDNNWFLLYLFEEGMRLRFFFRSLYVSKENKCFDKYTTFPDGSDLFLSMLVVVCCSLKIFAMFLE